MDRHAAGRCGQKGNFGHVLILAGSLGKTGAAAMAARAALRAGAGLVTVATAKSALPIIATLGVEFMTEALPETSDGSISVRALEGDRLGQARGQENRPRHRPGIGGTPKPRSSCGSSSTNTRCPSCSMRTA